MRDNDGTPAVAARGGRLWPFLLLAALVALTFWPVGGYDYVWDDLYVHLHANPLVTGFDLDAVGRLFADSWLGLYVPLTYVVWGAAWQLLPAEELPGALHLLNLALHLGNALLVMAISRRLLPAAGTVAAFLGALVFAVHPVQVETVAWISELRALGAAFLGLLAVWLAVRCADTRRPWIAALALALLTLLASLFKPAAVVGPPTIFLLLWGFRLTGWRRALLLAGPALVVGLGLALTNAIVQTSVGETPDTGLFERVRIAAYVLLHYLESVVWPFDLSPLYSINQETANGRWAYDNALGLVSIVVVLTIALCRRRSRRWTLVALFLLGIAPVSGIIPFAFQKLAYVADRYLYWSMLAVALAVVMAVSRLASLLPAEGGQRHVPAALVGVVVLIAGIFTHLGQLPLWKDEPALWRGVLERQGALVPASNNLGRALRRLGDPAGALDAYDLSLQENPEDRTALYGKALSALDLGDDDLAEGVLRKLLEVAPEHPLAPLQLASIEVRRGEYLAAIEWLNLAVPALRSSPDPRHRRNLAHAYYLRVLSLVNLKEDELVLQEAEKALQVRPDYAEVYMLRAVSLVRLGRREDAIADLRRALELGQSLDAIRHLAFMAPLIAEAESG